MWPVLQDTTCLRQWWVPDAVRAGCVHEILLPLLCGHFAHPSDSSLRGVWVRRQEWSPRANTSESTDTARHMEAWRQQRQEDLKSAPCFRMALPNHHAWNVLRKAGHVQQKNGAVMGIAGTEVGEVGAGTVGESSGGIGIQTTDAADRPAKWIHMSKSQQKNWQRNETRRRNQGGGT